MIESDIYIPVQVEIQNTEGAYSAGYESSSPD